MLYFPNCALTARLHLWNRSDPVFGIDLGTVLCAVYTIQIPEPTELLSMPLASRDLTTPLALGVVVNAQLQGLRWKDFVVAPSHHCPAILDSETT